MKRQILSVLVGIALIGVLAAPGAWADNPHFINATVSIQDNGNLLCSFKEAGLGTGPVNIQCAAENADALYFCINKGGNHPAAQNKETVSSPVGGIQLFTPSGSGQITGSISVAPPGPGSFTCPGGQSLFLVEVTYTNVTLSDITSGVLGASAATLSSGCLLPAKYASLCP
jgi:hypothetical protein